MIIAILVLAIEATFLCQKIKSMEKIVEKVGIMKWWMKSIFYIFFSSLLFALCVSIAGAAPFCFIFCAGVAYGWGVFVHRRATGNLC